MPTQPYCGSHLCAALRGSESRLARERGAFARAVEDARAIIAALQAPAVEQAHRAAGEGHCMACGHEGSAGAFCSHCGAHRPRVLDCQCGTRTTVPLHLTTGELKAKICCPSCGRQLVGAVAEEPAKA